MTSSSTRATVTSSAAFPGRSLLSKLKSPLQSKTRHFADFYIQPDDPHRQYAPGDIISGSVILKVLKPFRITHLVISLHGYAQVFKNPNSPGDAYRHYSATLAAGDGKKGGRYFGNGFASLFEDEVVLCGEGRLGEGVYHFNFELEFPRTGLPSSIDFERGTIAYMLTSTLTRPTTISPTTSCETKVNLMDTIDVAPIAEPKPRIISLEPISRRTRAKTASRKRLNTHAEHAPAQLPGNTDASRIPRLSELSSGAEDSDVPGSPAPSDVSFESQFSSGNASGTEYGIRSINTAVEDTSQNSIRTLKDKTITAAIHVLKGGFLRGDQIPIKVSVIHTKPVRSLKGTIVTLYRQARVDMHPALSILPNSKGDKTKSEDYFPKSLTGLSGLSLSSAGSSHLFRKDLSQSFAPLFVDPRTLTAEVKCAVRVPEEAFPTISNVPGAMISFKYFVEVVVDIQGKLSGLDRMISSSGLVNVPAASGGAQGTGRADDGTGSMFSTWGGTFVDTDALRREKGVISCIFEVVIGTKDSERTGKRKQPTQEPALDPQKGVHELPQDQPHDNTAAEADLYAYDNDDAYYNHDGQYYDHYAYDDAYTGAYDDSPAYREGSGGQPPYPAPAANPQDEEGLSEKERIRRAEARLLPSAPVVDTAGPSMASSAHGAMAPSAPILPEDDESYTPTAMASSSAQTPPFPMASYSPATPTMQQRRTHAEDETRTATTGPITMASNATPNLHKRSAEAETEAEAEAHLANSASLPQYSSPPISPQTPTPTSAPIPHVHPTDDKQELQRRRLEMERSAPPPSENDDDGDAAADSPAGLTEKSRNAPSAPVLEDDGEGMVHSSPDGAEGESRTSEALPVYSAR